MKSNSKSILFICPYPIGQAPSQRFRFEQYLTYLEVNGYKYDFKPFLSEKGWRSIYKDGKTNLKLYHVLIGFIKRLFFCLFLDKYSHVFLHREATPLGPPIFEWIIAKVFRKKIIYDFDDAIWLDDPDEKGSLHSKIKWKSKVALICKWSHKVSTGNEYLAHFARNYNSDVVVNPTTIDTERLHNPTLLQKSETLNRKTVIGWTGTHSTLQYLEPMLPIIAELEKNHNFEFVVIADKDPQYKLNSFQFIPWNKETEIADLVKIDIGIMPLTDDTWSEGKCGFKLLQYMALEKPALASSVGVNTEIISDQVNGFLCDSNEEWFCALQLLIGNHELRMKLGKLGRKKVLENYSTISNQASFLSLFE